MEPGIVMLILHFLKAFKRGPFRPLKGREEATRRHGAAVLIPTSIPILSSFLRGKISDARDSLLLWCCCGCNNSREVDVQCTVNDFLVQTIVFFAQCHRRCVYGFAKLRKTSELKISIRNYLKKLNYMVKTCL